MTPKREATGFKDVKLPRLVLRRAQSKLSKGWRVDPTEAALKPSMLNDPSSALAGTDNLVVRR